MKRMKARKPRKTKFNYSTLYLDACKAIDELYCEYGRSKSTTPQDIIELMETKVSATTLSGMLQHLKKEHIISAVNVGFTKGQPRFSYKLLKKSW